MKKIADKFFPVVHYIQYFLKALPSSGHGIHSPFIFSFSTKVLHDKKLYQEYNIVKKLKKKLFNNNQTITLQGFGSKSDQNNGKITTIHKLAELTSVSEKYGKLLFRVVKYFQPKSILELGTSLGISTIYMSLANNKTKITTVEGEAELDGIIRKGFSETQCSNINLIIDDFDHFLNYSFQA